MSHLHRRKVVELWYDNIFSSIRKVKLALSQTRQGISIYATVNRSLKSTRYDEHMADDTL